MPQFFVQSGSLRTVVSAESVEKAAVWAVHQVMQQIMPLDQAADVDEAMSVDESAIEDSNETLPILPINRVSRWLLPHQDPPVAVLSGRVRVARRDGDGESSVELKTIDVLAKWNHMVLTLDRLETMIRRAG